MYMMYGIKNCNTVKNSIDWLAERHIPFEFMDVKKNILDLDVLSSWVENMPSPYTWESLVNRSGMTWRKLDENEKKNALSQLGALNLILKKPSVMKRPVIVKANKIITIGFNEKIFIVKFL